MVLLPVLATSDRCSRKLETQCERCDEDDDECGKRMLTKEEEEERMYACDDVR